MNTLCHVRCMHHIANTVFAIVMRTRNYDVNDFPSENLKIAKSLSGHQRARNASPTKKTETPNRLRRYSQYLTKAKK